MKEVLLKYLARSERQAFGVSSLPSVNFFRINSETTYLGAIDILNETIASTMSSKHAKGFQTLATVYQRPYLVSFS